MECNIWLAILFFMPHHNFLHGNGKGNVTGNDLDQNYCGQPWEGREAVCWDLAPTLTGHWTEAGDPRLNLILGGCENGLCWSESPSWHLVHTRLPTFLRSSRSQEPSVRFPRVAILPTASQPCNGLELHRTPDCLPSCGGSTCPRGLAPQRNHVTV